MHRSWDLRNGCPPGLADDIAARLRAGEVGLLPTETVYGLMASSTSPEACARIFKIKGRDASKFLPFMTARARLALADAPRSRVAAKLARILWPGPLTLVLGDAPGKAWRIPDHPLLHDVLRRLHDPLVATSANSSGLPPPASVDAIEPLILAACDFSVLDGPTGSGPASTVVRIEPNDSVRILRAGVLPAARIQELARFRVELVCTGNTCRSPLAEAILARQLADLPGVQVRSCGTSGVEGALASDGALRTARALGLDLSGHRSRGLPADLCEADLILCMTPEHREQVESRCLPAGGPEVALVSMSGTRVADPWGGSLADYAEVAGELSELLGHWAARIRQDLMN